MPASSTNPRLDDAPLSSFSLVPLTSETRTALLAAGVTETSLIGLTELGGQSLLALQAHMDEDDTKPDCYQSGYDPTSKLCAGCIVMPSCWRSCLAYLRRVGQGTAKPPPGVPSAVVTERVAIAGALPEPPAAPSRKKASPKRAPPPPPRR